MFYKPSDKSIILEGNRGDLFQREIETVEYVNYRKFGDITVDDRRKRSDYPYVIKIGIEKLFLYVDEQELKNIVQASNGEKSWKEANEWAKMYSQQ